MPPIPLAGALRWSDPATWGGVLPGATADVVVPAGRTIALDTNATVRSLVIEGTVVVPNDATIELNAERVLVRGGALQVGSEPTPFAGRFTLTLTGSDPNVDVFGVGTKFLAAFGGVVDLHGAPKLAWTRISRHANAGATQLTLAQTPVGWRVGDRVAIAPTDYEPREAETRTVTAISGSTVTLDAPLTYNHWGELMSYNGSSLDQRAEVANLSRNITVRGDAASAALDFGGHAMFMGGAQVRLANVEFTAMGQLGKAGRYPVHFHLQGEAGARGFVRNLAIHNTFQRGLVIHQTNGLQVADSVIYNTVGMQYFLEDGVEVRNVFERNLGMLARKVPNDKSLSTERIDRGDNGAGPERSAIFWITNQHNVFRNNVAVGVERGWGYAFRDSDVLPVNRPLAPLPADAAALGKLPPLEFSNNYARTIAASTDVFNLGYGPEEAGSCMRIGGGGGDGQGVPITNFTAFKCFNAAIWGTNDRPVVGGTFADVRSVVTQDQGVPSNPVIRDATVVAFTANDPRNAAGGGLPRGPFGVFLYEATDAGPTFMNNVSVIGRFPADEGGQVPQVNGAVAATVAAGSFRLKAGPAAFVPVYSGGSFQVPITVERAGYEGPITISIPDYSVNPRTAGLSADPVTIAAGATTGTLVVRGVNTQATPKVFPLYAIASGGGRTKLDVLGQLELAPAQPLSRPGVNVGLGYFQYGDRGMSNMEFNRGVGFAFDGQDSTFAHASGQRPYMEWAADNRFVLRELRLSQPAPTADYPAWGDFVVLYGDFYAMPLEGMTLEQARALPGVKSIDVPGLVGSTSAPTVVPFPAGTTARWARIWMKGSGQMRLTEMQVIGG